MNKDDHKYEPDDYGEQDDGQQQMSELLNTLVKEIEAVKSRVTRNEVEVESHEARLKLIE